MFLSHSKILFDDYGNFRIYLNKQPKVLIFKIAPKLLELPDVNLTAQKLITFKYQKSLIKIRGND